VFMNMVNEHRMEGSRVSEDGRDGVGRDATRTRGVNLG
jgi:hypothetical protein